MLQFQEMALILQEEKSTELERCLQLPRRGVIDGVLLVTGMMGEDSDLPCCASFGESRDSVCDFLGIVGR